ncbi:uncharacterized protein bod1l1 [Xenentodon cancila]
MAGLPPGDPQLVSMIVNHLKTQGLFDQFRRDCLADVDTKPAYLNLKQRVDNFVSNHLSNHTWSPHLNKNQLRNNIRQLVLQSGMLEQGVDRIVAQVVDPKINHIFRPQVESVVREFLSPGSCSEEPLAPLPPAETKPDVSIPEQDSSMTPVAASASDAMSILDTISSLNQEASVRSTSTTEKGRKIQTLDDPMQVMEETECDMDLAEESDSNQEVKSLEEAEGAPEAQTTEEKVEDKQEQMEVEKEGLIEDVKMEVEESGCQEQKEEEGDKPTGKAGSKPLEEKLDEEAVKSTNQAKQKARERIKEEYSLEDSDLEGLSDITVSSVHTSDLSSFEEESDEEEQLLDSSEEGELPPDGERAEKHSGDTEGEGKECKPRRKAYVHKPFLYSRYYSDSDDEITVEERRRSVAKDKEERLLKRQQNRERLEEKLKQKAAQDEEQDPKKHKIADSAGLESPKAKEARKERKVLEKKMALNRKRKLDLRKEGDVSSKKKGDTGDLSKKTEAKTSKSSQPKLMRNLSESASSDERHRRTSGSISEDSSDTKKLPDKGRTHSFILELEQGSQEALKQRSVGKFDRLSRKEPHSKERRDKDRSLSDDRTKLKQKQEKKSEHQADETQHKESTAVKVSSEEKGEKKPKNKSDKKLSGSTREGKVTEGVAEDGSLKDAKKVKGGSTESVKAEKDKEKDKTKDKDKNKEKEKSKGEKISVKSDMKQLLRPDSAGSSEDRSDMEPGSDSTKKRDKHSKEVLKRSKSHTEDRPVDKPKSKTDSEKEKTKMDPNSQKLHKSTPDMDKEPKKVKPTEKGKILEKSKTRSKEEAKTLLKTDKKVQSLDVKSAGGGGISKAEATKEKRRDGSAKEQRKVSDEASQEKSELKSAKKKLEKKDKVPEKKDDVQDDKMAPRVETSDKSSKSSVSSLSLEIEEPPKKPLPLQDTSTDSDPVTTTVTTLLSDDTCDALSDITPEPPEGEAESRLGEMSAVPAEADALLTLMDVCTSAEARLPHDGFREEMTPEIELCDADLKMKEAALTLLSMDPDSTISSSLICQSTREEPPTNLPDPQPMETTTAEEEKQMQPSPETELPATEPSAAVAPQTAESVDGSKVIADECENTETKIDAPEIEASEMGSPQEDDAALKEQETESDEIPVESVLDEKTAASADGEGADVVVSETEELVGETENTTAVVSEDPEQVLKTPSEPGEGETKTAEEDAVEEDLQSEEEKDGRGRRKRKLSAQKDAPLKESGDIRDEEEGGAELQSGEVIGKENAEEGRLSKATDEAETSRSEETHRGRCSGAAEEEAAADLQKKDESEAEDISDEASSLKAAEQETAENEPETSIPGGSEVSLASPGPEQGEDEEDSDYQKTNKKDKKAEDKGDQQNDDDEEEEDEEDKETSTRATTRAASRLEAERNKPSKPSTRASRQGGKDEPTAGTRGTRGQVAAKGARKREASPPAVRTRGGQKPEEPPSKRAKR